MEHIRTYYKHSNTGEVISSTESIGSVINFPIRWYDINGQEKGTFKMEGFVEISSKTFNKLKRKHKRSRII